MECIIRNGRCQEFYESRLSNIRIQVIPFFTERLQLFEPDHFQQCQLVAEIEIRILTHLHNLQDLKNKTLCPITVPIFLKSLVSMTPNFECKFVSIQCAVQVQAASQEYFTIRS